MTIFSNKNRITNQDIKLLEKLLGKKVTAINNLSHGLNSRIQLVTFNDQSKLVIKLYYLTPEDIHNRLETEFNSLTFLWKNNIRNIPRPILLVKAKQFALYEYFEGPLASQNPISANDILIACNFLLKLQKLRFFKESRLLPRAKEACFSYRELITNINERLNKLLKLPNSRQNRKLHTFLKNSFIILFDKLKNSLPKSHLLPPKYRILSPSDFGFHNAIRKGNGQLVFFDFEYFGFDDPAKTISDFLLHPQIKLTTLLKKKFINTMITNLTEDKMLARRLNLVFPLYGLKWCLIFLNEFLPQDYRRRKFARNIKLDKEKILTQQLAKADKLLSSIKKDHNLWINVPKA